MEEESRVWECFYCHLVYSVRERERDELDAVGRERHCRKEGEGILDSREIVL